MQHTYLHLCIDLAKKLEAEQITYYFIHDASLYLQGVKLAELKAIDIAIQWDLFQKAKELFQHYSINRIEGNSEWSKFDFIYKEVPINIICYYNTVVAADPHRVRISIEGCSFWTKSIYYYLRDLAPDNPRIQWIRSYLRKQQQEISRKNEAAWTQSSYEAWVNRYGIPAEAAERIKKNPAVRLAPLTKYLGEVKGKNIMNLLGSHGSKAVALSLLGANVTVVDISAENAWYARELAEVAEVDIRYIVSDVLELPEEELAPKYNVVFMELGVLHYFVDLQPLTTTIARLLVPGGRFILHDFHPISTKLITSKGKKHKVTGNYFDSSLCEVEVAYAKHLSDDRDEVYKVFHRRWTLGEVVTAVADAGLFIRLLEEDPNTKTDDIGIPKTFTLVAEKS